jgi:hypothetical protein
MKEWVTVRRLLKVLYYQPQGVREGQEGRKKTIIDYATTWSIQVIPSRGFSPHNEDGLAELGSVAWYVGSLAGRDSQKAPAHRLPGSGTSRGLYPSGKMRLSRVHAFLIFVGMPTIRFSY